MGNLNMTVGKAKPLFGERKAQKTNMSKGRVPIAGEKNDLNAPENKVGQN